MAPANMNRQDIEMRNVNTLKLANLSFGITAHDLEELLTQTKAQTCFIPRTRDRYVRARYAFISFKTENQMLEVQTQKGKYAIKNNHVY